MREWPVIPIAFRLTRSLSEKSLTADHSPPPGGSTEPFVPLRTGLRPRGSPKPVNQREQFVIVITIDDCPVEAD